MEFVCTKCGKVHGGWPAIGYSAPHPYYTLSADEKDKFVREINDDFCVIEYEHQTDRFIRAVLFQKVNDYCEDLQYGVWVSLSAKNYENYKQNFFSEDQQGVYFGYLSSHLSGYEPLMTIKTNVMLRPGRERPEVIPHEDQMDIEFVRDYYNGIDKEEAEQRLQRLGWPPKS